MQHVTRRHTKGRSRGFTLVELMVVVAVLAIVTTIALPGYQNSKMAANETSAIASLKYVSTAQNQYRLRFGSFATLSNLQSTGLLDESYQDSIKSGYTFANVNAPSGQAWDMRADPLQPGISGNKYFIVDQSGVIRFREGGQATVTDPPIDGI